MTAVEPREARRQIRGGIVAGLLVVATTTIAWLAWNWFVGEATWPPELDDSAASALFSNPENPTEEDRALLTAVVSEIAERDPIVIDLLDGEPWPEPEIRPVIWVGDEGRSALIGGVFELDLEGADYFGPWPSAGCTGGSYRGTVLDARALHVERVSVSIDVNFERVTHLSIGPTALPVPGIETGASTPTSVAFVGEFPDDRWYTGRCKRSFGPN